MQVREANSDTGTGPSCSPVWAGCSGKSSFILTVLCFPHITYWHESSRTLKYRINLGLPCTTPLYGVNTTYLLPVTVSDGVLRLEAHYPAGLSELYYIPQGH